MADYSGGVCEYDVWREVLMASYAGGVCEYDARTGGANGGKETYEVDYPHTLALRFGGRPVLSSSIGGGGAGPMYYYRMRAQDSGVPLPGYVSWTVVMAPDFAGVGYGGGTPTPVGPAVPGSIIVAGAWRAQE